MSKSPRQEADSSTTAPDKDVLECPTCGNTYDTKHGLLTHRGQYCDGVTGVQYECDWCGKKDTKRPSQFDEAGHNFCGRDCWASWWAKRNESKVEYECDYCASVFDLHKFRLEQADMHFCPDSDCYAQWQSENRIGENAPQWKGGYDDYYGPNWKRQRRKAWERDNRTCQACGATKEELGQNPSVHHIRPIRWFKENYDEPEWYEKANDLDNLICLCRQNGCHKRWEGIPLKPL